MTMPDKTSVIIKSLNDTANYRYITLKNELRVLLVNDATTEKAVASLDIHVGQLDDPKDFQGLAHYLEHLLFMGTADFPDVDHFNKCLSNRGGSSNAYTSLTHTNYHFDVQHEHFDEILHIWSKFFISPLFDESTCDAEINAVDSEHAKNINNDNWRLARLERLLHNPEHPASFFGTGNLETLKETPLKLNVAIRDVLIDFYKNYYSANLMCLVLLGRESLDNLSAIAAKYFSDVPNTSAKTSSFTDIPLYLPEHKEIFVSYLPIMDIIQLNLEFTLQDVRSEYKSEPLGYMSHLLGHEADGSIYAYLKHKGWVTSLSAYGSHSIRGASSMTVAISLTESGHASYQQVVGVVMKFIYLLQESGPQESEFKDLQHLRQLRFDYLPKQSPLTYAIGIASHMHTCGEKDVLCSYNVASEYNPELIANLTNQLTLKNCRIFLGARDLSKSETENTPKDFSREHYYVIQYKIEPFSASLIAITDPAAEILGTEDLKLRLPAKNPFIPESFDLVTSSGLEDQLKDTNRRPSTTERRQSIIEASPYAKGGSPFDIPVIIKEEESFRMWYKLDKSYNLPKAHMVVKINAKHAYDSPLDSVLLALFIELAKDELTPISYPAELAGMRMKLNMEIHGYKITLEGYHHRFHEFLSQVLDKIIHLKVNRERLAVRKHELKLHLINQGNLQPYQHAIYNFSELTRKTLWTTSEKKDVIDQVDVDIMAAYIDKIKKNISAEVMVMGNLDVAASLSLADLIERFLSHQTILQHKDEKEEDDNSKSSSSSSSSNDQSQVYPLSQAKIQRHLKFEPGFNYTSKSYETCQKISAIKVVFPTGINSIAAMAMSKLLSNFASERFFNELRTVQQLGYLVHASAKIQTGVSAIRFIVQGEKSPEYFDHQIEIFLSELGATICEMPIADFKAIKASTISGMLEPYMKLKDEAKDYWYEIEQGSNNFLRKHQEAKFLQTTEKEDLVQFYDKFLRPGSPDRIRIASLAYGTDHAHSKKELDEIAESATTAALHKNRITIEHATEYKRGRSDVLYPLPSPRPATRILQ